jgi:ABC-2 type transport system permease protein
VSGGVYRLAWAPTWAVFKRHLADRRRALVWWLLGVVGSGVLIVAFWPSIEGNTAYDEALADLPDSLKTLMGVGEDISLSSPAGYLNSQWFTTMLPVLLLVFGIGAGASSIAGTEADGSLEDLLFQPVTRREVAVGRLKAIWLMAVVLSVVGTLAVVVPGAPIGLVDGLTFSGLAAVTVGVTLLVLLHTSLAFALGAATGERGIALGGASAVAAVGYLIYGIGQGVPSLKALADYSPWDWALSGPPITEGFSFVLVVPALILTLLLPAAGIWRFERRDLR